MKPERWQQIRDLLEKALELAPEQRPAFLDRACSSDQSLRREVETLIASSDDIRSSFLQSMPVPVTLAPGTRLGEYEIVVLVGSGGMGEVYRARDARLGRDVAIKVLPTYFAADSQRLRRFEQEARAAAALNHPNILAVHQMGTHQGAPYLVSELLEGETLRGLLKRGRLAVRKAIDYGVQIARGLAAAHEKGIVHRDLKPENLFVTKDGRVKILDFGLAKLTQRQASSDPGAPTVGLGTEAGVVMGTVGYMAPEQVRGETADHRTDIFSFGAILYEMLTGTRAFQRPTSAETMTAILNEDPPSISQVTTNIPPALQRVVHRCLEKSPEQRFQNASDLAFALDALSEGSAPSLSAAPARPAIKRTRRLAVAGGIALLLLAAALAVYRYSFRRPQPFRQIEITQLTTNGKVKTAAISPDGKYVAYAVNEIGVTPYFGGKTKQSLWVRQVAGGDVQVAPPAEVGYLGLTFSPDGQSLYAVRSEKGSSENSVYKMPVLGGAAKRLYDRLGLIGPVTLSPDGEQMAWGDESGEKSESSLVVADEAGRWKTTLATKTFPNGYYQVAWSPDGRAIGAVVGHSESGSIEWDPVVFDLQDKSERALTHKKWSDVQQLAWMPDGHGMIVAASERMRGLRQLEYVSYPNGEIRRITNDLNDYLGVSSAVNSQILATVQEKFFLDTWAGSMADPDGVKPITSGGRSMRASWSPDGKIVYDQLGGRGERDIWIMDADGGNATQLTTNLGLVNRAPRVTPNGRYVVFVYDDVSPHLWRIDRDGNNPKQLSNSPSDLLQVGFPDFTPDGKWVVYGKWGPEWGIWKFPLEGGDPVQLNHTRYAAFPAVSPDGRMLAYTYLDDSLENGVAVMSLENDVPEKRFGIATEALRWSPDSQSLLYVDTEGGVSNIWSQPISGGSRKQITHFNSELIDSFDVSRDDKWIVMSRGRRDRDVVLVRDVQ
jgi:Tol biopolymer transport system component